MEKKLVSLKNIIIGILIGAVVVYGLSYVETNDEKTVRLICAGASFLTALFFFFLSWKINLTEDIFRFFKQSKMPVWDPFHWLDADNNLKPKLKSAIRIYYLIGCLMSFGVGVAFFFIFK